MSIKSIDDILDILGNETRRKILRLLADEPRYFIQLSRDLGVSQQAVLKHLEILEKSGLIKNYEEDSDFPAPKRKYFQIDTSFMLSIGMTKDAVDFVFQDIPRQESEDEEEERELKALRRRVESLEEEEDAISVVNESDELLKQINSKVKELNEVEISLLRMKQRITKVAHEAIRRSFDEELQRHILYSTIGEEKRSDVDELSELLDTREKEISRALKVLKQRLANPKPSRKEDTPGAEIF
jgi:ArsR family transcriptional regulator